MVRSLAVPLGHMKANVHRYGTVTLIKREYLFTNVALSDATFKLCWDFCFSGDFMKSPLVEQKR